MDTEKSVERDKSLSNSERCIKIYLFLDALIYICSCTKCAAFIRLSITDMHRKDKQHKFEWISHSFVSDSFSIQFKAELVLFKRFLTQNKSFTKKGKQVNAPLLAVAVLFFLLFFFVETKRMLECLVNVPSCTVYTVQHKVYIETNAFAISTNIRNAQIKLKCSFYRYRFVLNLSSLVQFLASM